MTRNVRRVHRAQPADPPSPAEAARGVGRRTSSRWSATPPTATRRCWPAASAPTSPAAAPTSSSATMSRCPNTAGTPAQAAGAARAPARGRLRPGAGRHPALHRHAAQLLLDLRRRGPARARRDRRRSSPAIARMNIPLLDEGARRRLAGPVRAARRSTASAHESGPNRFRSQMILTPSHTRDLRLDPGPAGPLRGAGSSCAEVNGEPAPDHRRPAHGRHRLLVGPGLGAPERRRRQRGRRRVHRRQRRLLAARHPLPARRRRRGSARRTPPPSSAGR